ncbi:MAG: hypothetical protein MZV65_03980 [Chromatiales bacterium]|nr:hypothetical protein [Chromatiales bacterium]
MWDASSRTAGGIDFSQPVGNRRRFLNIVAECGNRIAVASFQEIQDAFAVEFGLQQQEDLVDLFVECAIARCIDIDARAQDMRAYQRQIRQSRWLNSRGWSPP